MSRRSFARSSLKDLYLCRWIIAGSVAGRR